MEEIYAKARAKINLNLEILDKRPDNYHNLKSVFQKVNLYDELVIKKTNTNDIKIKTNVLELNNKDNIIYKAYVKLKEQFEEITGVEVYLNKKIPMQAGMAGGSTDCASFILCMNKLFNLNMTKDKIISLGKSLGADVVPCMYNKALLAEGIGDIITPINTNFKYYIVAIKPQIDCSTKEMYEKLDSKVNRKIIDTSSKIIEALKSNNIKLLAKNLYNAFENTIGEKCLIENIKHKLIQNGAVGSLMTGSGSCVFGIFESKNLARTAYRKLKQDFETYICTSYNSKKESIV